MRVWNHWKSKCEKVSFCQPTMVVKQACAQEFFRTEEVSRNKGYLFKRYFSYNKQTKGLLGKNLDFFHLVTPKAAFLIKNLHIDPYNLGIFPNKQGHSFQFSIKSSGGFPLPLVVCACWHILRILCLLP